MRRRVLGALANFALSLASLLLFWLLLELVLFPALLYRLPLALQPYLTERGVRTLAQSSKRGTLPKDYVALAGDSYAAGDGDWFQSIDQRGNGPFHSAHLIHAWTGRDVISFGRSGAGSLRGALAEPLTELALLRRTARLRVEDPRDLLVYFYGGNDVEDNLEDLRKRYDPEFDRAELRDPAVFRRFLEEVVIGRDSEQRKAEAFRPWWNFFVARALRYRFDVWRRGEAAEAEGGGDPLPPRAAGPHAGTRRKRRFHRDPSNFFLVGGEVVEVKRKLQAPAVVLRPDEIDLGLWVFEQALRMLAERLPETRLRVLYIPAPLSCYRLAADVVEVDSDHYRDRPVEYPAGRVAERSDLLCRSVAEIAARLGAPFHDARPELRAVAEDRLVHGPKDWKHFNRAGHEALARAAIAALEATPGGGCAASAPPRGAGQAAPAAPARPRRSRR